MKTQSKKILSVFLSLSLVFTFLPVSSALAEESASTKASVKVTLTTEQEALVAMTYGETEIKSGDSVESGQNLTLTISNGASDTNVLMPKAVSVNGVAKSFTFTKSAWRETNTLYNQKMGGENDMATFDKMVASTVTIDAGTISADTTISVEFQTVVPVYRLYNKLSSEHLFTTNKVEYDDFEAKCKANTDAWIPEGIDWLAPVSGTTVYRLYNPTLGAMARSSHYYTTSETERANLKASAGWLDDFNGTAVFYSGGDKAIFTMYNEALGSAHHLTSSLTEYKGLVQHGWDIESDKSLKDGKWVGFFKSVMGAKSDEGDTEDWSGDIMIGAFTISDNDWSDVVYYSNDGYTFISAATAYQDNLQGQHLYAEPNHYCMTCPSIIYKDGWFWMLTSGGSWIDGDYATFCISYSQDLKTWTAPELFKARINGARLGNNHCAPEWFIDEDTNRVYIVTTIGDYGAWTSSGWGNDSMRPYICEVSNLTASGMFWYDNVYLPSGLAPTFTEMQCMNSVVNAERGSSVDNLLDGCIYKENGQYYFVIKNKGLWNDVFVSNDLMADNWTKATPNAISWGYEAPSLAKFNGKYMLFMDGVEGTLPVGTRVQTSTSITGGWGAAAAPNFITNNGAKIASRHGSVYVLKAGSAGWTQLKTSLGLS